MGPKPSKHKHLAKPIQNWCRDHPPGGTAPQYRTCVDDGFRAAFFNESIFGNMTNLITGITDDIKNLQKKHPYIFWALMAIPVALFVLIFAIDFISKGAEEI